MVAHVDPLGSCVADFVTSYGLPRLGLRSDASRRDGTLPLMANGIAMCDMRRSSRRCRRGVGRGLRRNPGEIFPPAPQGRFRSGGRRHRYRGEDRSDVLMEIARSHLVRSASVRLERRRSGLRSVLDLVVI